MTDIAVTDVTTIVVSRDCDIGHGSIMKNITIATVTFGDAALTYVAGGVPMPAIGAFGFKREIQFCAIQAPLNVYKYTYDKTNNKIYISDAAAEFSGAPAATTLTLLLIGE